MNLQYINNLSVDEAKQLFLDTCHCRRWAEDMCLSRPFNNLENLLEIAAILWRKSTEREILEATLGHKKIGDVNALRDAYHSNTRAEQGQVLQASEDVLMELKQLNDKYIDKFDFIFIVCATGKSASEMLNIVKQRINNSYEEELKNVAIEQEKIINIRLQKLLETP